MKKKLTTKTLSEKKLTTVRFDFKRDGFSAIAVRYYNYCRSTATHKSMRARRGSANAPECGRTGPAVRRTFPPAVSDCGKAGGAQRPLTGDAYLRRWSVR